MGVVFGVTAAPFYKSRDYRKVRSSIPPKKPGEEEFVKSLK
jgi:hypothetical protein